MGIGYAWGGGVLTMRVRYHGGHGGGGRTKTYTKPARPIGKDSKQPAPIKIKRS
jgi:hypothetical protein